MTPDLDKLSELAGKAINVEYLERQEQSCVVMLSDDYDDVDEVFSSVPALIEEVRRLRKVLAWYGDLALYECPNPSTCTAKLCVLGDRGQRAREVLK